MKTGNILVLDIGTTGIKGIVFDASLAIVARSYRRIGKKVLSGGRVEQNPKEILSVSRAVLRQAIQKSGLSASSFAGMGITNQRETTILWDRATGKPVHPAIVWEDTRTSARCRSLRGKYGAVVRERTGLSLDPYFSASKIEWILKNVKGVRERAERGEIAFGTVDAWVLWNFLEGHPHVTDYTNASRTMLLNIKKLCWDADLLKIFDIPSQLMSAVMPTAGEFGVTQKEALGFSMPVLAVCGDQQASLFAAGLDRGTTKVTYGTGGFVSQVIGEKFKTYDPFFTTLAPMSVRPVYVLEGKVNDCGKRVSAVLKDPARLRKTVAKITQEVARYLLKLPLKFDRIIVDGGVTKYPDLVPLQSAAADVAVARQKIYDGTALGAAMLVAAARNGSNSI